MMNLGKGFSISEENDIQQKEFWTPVTPDKHIQNESNVIPTDMQRGSNWNELLGIYGGLLNETINGAEVQNFDPGEIMLQVGGCQNANTTGNIDVNSNAADLQIIADETVNWNDNPLAEFFGMKSDVPASMPSSTQIPITDIFTSSNSYTQPVNGWSDSLDHHNILCPNQRINDGSPPQIPKDGSITYLPEHNLHSPSRPEATTIAGLSTVFPLAPVTPDHGKQLWSHHMSENMNISEKESSSGEKSKQGISSSSSIRNEVHGDNCDELQKNIVESLSVGMPTTLVDVNNSDTEGIDLKKTPQQKTPRRKKHRPKVVIEGKVKRGRKPQAPKIADNSSEKPPEKRKYVRKKIHEVTSTPREDVTEETGPSAGSETKSCRQALNFDFGNGKRDESHDSLKLKTTPEKPSGKRKYVRKKGVQAATQQDITNDVTSQPNGSKARSCKRVLNFSLENEMRGNSPEKFTGAHQTDAMEQVTVSSAGYKTRSSRQELDFDIENGIRDESHDSLKLNTPPEKPSGKRKYVRKKGVGVATQQDITNDVISHPNGSEAEPCRRALNFNLENEMRGNSPERSTNHRTEMHEESRPSELNLGFHGTELPLQINSLPVKKPSHHHIQLQYGHIVDKQKAINTSNFPHSANYMPSGHVQLPEQHALLANMKERRLNIIARALNMRNNANLCVASGNNNSSQVQHVNGNVTQHVVLRSDTAALLNNNSQYILSGSSHLIENDWIDLDRMGNRKDYGQSTNPSHPFSVPLMGSPKLWHKLLNEGENNSTESNNYRHLECNKKQKTQNQSYYPTVSSVLSCLQTTSMSGTQTRSYVSEMSNILSGPYLEGGMGSKIPNHRVNQTASSRYFQPWITELNLKKQYTFHAQSKDWGAEKTSQVSISVNDRNSICAITEVNMLPQIPSQKGPQSSHEQEIETRISNIPFTNQAMALALSNLSPGKGKFLQKQKNMHHNKRRSMNARGPLETAKPQNPVDEITFLLKGLNIKDGSYGIAGEDRTSLVLYKGDSRIVPFEGFALIKKRKSRPKVDLDSETNRIWNLLMGNEKIETTEALDQDKEKWWEEERRVFHGRVESFIARMHLVQGDRRFTKWKGSVVDSVIGVFLTQNVSDHLSSSAFMSLVSKYPGSSTMINQSCCENGNSVIVEHPDIESQESGVTVKDHEFMAGYPVHNQSPSESFSLANEELHSSSGSNSEEDHTCGKSDTKEIHPRIQLQTEKTAAFKKTQDHTSVRLNDGYNQSGSSKYGSSVDSGNLHTKASSVHSSDSQLNVMPGSEIGEVECYRQSTEESRSSHSAASENSRVNDVQHIAEGESRPTTQQKGIPEIENLRMLQCAHLSRHSPQSNNLKLGFHTTNNQNDINYQGDSSQVRASQACANQPSSHEPKETAEPSNVNEVKLGKDKKKISINTSTKTHKDGQLDSSSKLLGEDTNNSNVKKRKAEVRIQNSFDWDALRRQALSSCERRERSIGTMDSLDYDAIRSADVNEISNTIKERGMNNRLAERMKDFLDRLVREHGSVDLEWLRDVPPDSAKDYLLSIRGLGLKSVECVRLLTLHHLAFPVDTNVGRIAVRLGWVPLQPLPESLQLHLLELYPILESIQKYLWPRLCKLDQRTLYELHYQMITFGKVFCTKSKPNCNACPMRGECRHFASAFASARLALPGPEDKSIMAPTAPVYTDNTPSAIKTMALPDIANKNPATIVNPISLLLSASSANEVEGEQGNSEPIIEEPTTPEPTAIIRETDIEDALYDDDDEIPTIKLNMEEFSQNLQNYMQENNMALQEGNMSKALVVLDSQSASIPAPKLKNVSRLRTEHQVYELPDSHPLLKKLHRREPDDPSPYLLAIWTPGETANSIQPPESRCEFQVSGKMCHEKTCFSCNSTREENSHTVRGTILIPCRTAMRGSFPLNGTYFQVNEMFADHESSLNPIDVPRTWLWNLPRRTVYFGTSVTSIFKGLSTEGIQYCFWRGFVCVRGFDQKTRAPRPLVARLHFPASRLIKMKSEDKKGASQMQ